MADSIHQLSVRLVDSGLVSTDVLSGFLDETSSETASTEELTQWVIQKGGLTPFQVQTISDGNGKSLQLDQYVIQDRIGAGGMGEVYLAEHQQMERHVAIKILPTALSENPDSVERFRREVKAAARLNHPNIVTAFDANECQGTLYLVMEWVKGQDLATVVRAEGPLCIESALDVITQVAGGLRYAHDQGIIHRDIKPSNLLVDEGGTVKILDMGLARIESPSKSNGNGVVTADELTGTGIVMGTIDYMSPEQALDTRSADARSDLYSLGCTLFFLLTGRPLFVADTLTKKLLALQQSRPPSLHDFRSDVPRAIEEMYRKMIAKEPGDRFQSMSELTDALSKLTSSHDAPDQEPVSVVDPPDDVLSLPATVSVPNALEQSHGAANIEPRKQVTSVRLILAVATVLVMVVGAIVMWPGKYDVGKADANSDQETSSTDRPGDDGNAVAMPAGASDPSFALQFDGIDDFVFIDNFSHPRSQPVTYEATIVYQPSTEFETQAQSLVTQHGSIMLGANDHITAMLWNPDANRSVTSVSDTKPIRSSRRFRVAVTWDRVFYRVFVDGKLVGQKRLTSIPSFTEQNWIAIGGHPSKRGPRGGLCFPGLIDEVRISKVARYTGDYRPAERLGSDDATLALYHFDEGKGDLVKDASGNGHDGRINGAKWVDGDATVREPRR